MWIVEVALRRPYTFLVMALLILLATPLVLLKMSDRHLPGNQYSGDQHRLDLRRAVGAGGRPAHHLRSTSAASRPRSTTSSTSNRSRWPASRSSRSSSSRTPIFPTAIAQVVAIEQSQLRQLPPGILPPLVIKYSASSHSGHPARPIQPQHDRAGGVRCRREFPAPAAGDHPGRRRALALRRQAAGDFGRSRHQCVAGQGPDAQRRGQRGQCPESGAAVRHRQDRRHGIRARRPMARPTPSPG